MKKIIILLATILLTSCIKATYSISFVDMKTPTDTINFEVESIERVGHLGSDTEFKVEIENIGSENNPFLVHKVYCFGRTYKNIYTSNYPVYIVTYKYKE